MFIKFFFYWSKCPWKYFSLAKHNWNRSSDNSSPRNKQWSCERSMGARNRVGIGLSYRPASSWARICKPFKAPRKGFPTWRDGTTTLYGAPARYIGLAVNSKESIPGLLKHLEIWTQTTYAGGIDSLELIHGLLKSLQIRARRGDFVENSNRQATKSSGDYHIALIIKEAMKEPERQSSLYVQGDDCRGYPPLCQPQHHDSFSNGGGLGVGGIMAALPPPPHVVASMERSLKTRH